MNYFWTGLGISYLLSLVLILALCRVASNADRCRQRVDRIRRVVEER